MDKQKFLESYGWTVGERNPRINTDFPGAFMCVEPYDEDELPTKDGSNGPWCITGDNLEELIDEAHEFLTDFIDPAVIDAGCCEGCPYRARTGGLKS